MNATMSAGTDRRPRADTQRAGSALPRVLAGVRDGAHLTLAQHDAVHGPLPAVRGRGRRHAREGAARMIEEIAQSGLRGHGGAAFPVATKMHAVANARGRAIVVANATEGEPASLKDRTLLELLPHLVLDGGVLAAEALGADRLLVCVCDSSASAYEAATHALAERADHNESGVQVELVRTPRHYVAGQESALVNFLNGGPALPTFTPPMVFERGVARRPTLVNNAETLAHMALIARHGAAWFRELGTASQPGSALVTVSGPVVHPGVYEVEHGSSLASLIDACGGASVRRHVDRRAAPAYRCALQRPPRSTRRHARRRCGGAAVRAGLPGR
jgi:NADH:ubiquinone oxidoreductase subunit F (NADH-binding)